MACCDSAIDVRYEETCGDIFYFQEVDKEIEADNFTRSRNKPLGKWIKNKNHNFLIVQHEDQLVFKALQNQEQSSCDCIFTIETFRRDPKNTMDRGRPVLLYVINNGKYKLVCCDDQGKVHVDTRDSLPDSFKDSGDKGLFFLRSVPGTACQNIYKIEPSLCPSLLLGFDNDADDRSLLKLAALPHQMDQVDDRCNMELNE